MDRTALHNQPALNHPLRISLLALILGAFARLTWHLGERSIWWDESLSLQRAEQDWLPLILGHLVMHDGISAQLTIDQHPFFYFLLQGILQRLAGTSEFSLRFIAALAATLFVPALWSWSRALVRRGALPAATPFYAALLGATSPFLLWFGQEARPYTLWALLAVLSTHALLQTVWPQPVTHPAAHPSTTRPRRGAWLRYWGLLAAFLATHYYAIFLLPLHALGWFLRFRTRHPRLAWGIAAGLLGGGLLAASLAYYRIIVMQNGGGNFATIRLHVLIPDLLNAYSMGLSVDINQVWWLDLVFGAIALMGLVWMVMRPPRLWHGGLLPVLVVGLPVLAVLVLNLFIPAYMTARHLALIAGGYLVLVGGGLASIHHFRGWLAAPLAILLVSGAGYSSLNFYTDDQYRHNDFPAVGRHLANNLAEGDLLLLKPPFSWRIFDYYLPTAALEAAAAQGAHIHHLGVPRFVDSWETRNAELAALAPNYNRIWLVVLGTHPFLDLENRTEAWLEENLFRLHTRQFFSHSELSVSQYVPEVPVTWDAPPIPRPHAATFGDQLRLAGYALPSAVYDDLGIPVTLYWQTLAETDRHYKYILRLVAIEGAPDAPAITDEAARTEREPYDGAIPTIYWAPGQTIIEYTALIAHRDWHDLRARPEAYRLALEVYDAETLEKLPITAAVAPAIGAGETVFLPYAPE